MNRTIRIESPGCDNEGAMCPYLDVSTGECWGVDDEDTREGVPKLVVDHGTGCQPRFTRHVECPFGMFVAVIRLSRSRNNGK